MPPDNVSEHATETAEVAAFLRALAGRAERDAAFGRQIAALLVESGLLDVAAHPTLQPPPPVGEGEPDSRSRRGAHSRRASVSPPRAGEGSGERSDPFALLRERGEAHLRAHLAALDLLALRQIIRVHRLDPARISARWTNRERLVALIVDQVRARADHGKAFSRV